MRLPDLSDERWAIVTLLLVVAVFCAPMFFVDGIRQGDDFRDEDWLHDISFSFFLVEGLEDGELPLRSHLVGGGYPILGHPSDGTLSPFSLPFLALPPEGAVRLNLCLLLMIGSLGVFGVARQSLALSPAGALAAAAAFAVSGWFPSMMLTGFYVQAFYLLTPMALYLLLQGSARSAVGAGLVLLPVLLQGGPGIVAILHFLGLAVLVSDAIAAAPPAEREERAPRIALTYLGAVLAVSGLVSAVGAYLGGVAAVAVAAAVVGVTGWKVASTRWSFGRVLLLLVVLLTVGAAKVVSVVELSQRANDFFATDGGDIYPFGTPEDSERRFYEGVGSFLRHVQLPLEKETLYTLNFPHAEEYAPLALTAPVALAFVVACFLAWRRMAPWALLFLLYLALCFGPHGLGDPYRWFVYWLPGFGVIGDPYKYFNFFLVLCLALGFGVALEYARARTSHGYWLGAALLLWPVLQNSPLWLTLFAEPAEALEPASTFTQVALMPPEDMSGYNHPEMYREGFRPDPVREYFTIPAGFGVVNWYADLYLDEHAEPAWEMDGEWVKHANPEYQGEIRGDGCEVLEPRFTANTIAATVRGEGPCLVTVNQEFAPGWEGDGVEVVDEDGLLGLRIDAPGELAVRYRPRWLLASLGVSLVSLLGWVGWLGAPRRRRT